jgi:hypothetical protein
MNRMIQSPFRQLAQSPSFPDVLGPLKGLLGVQLALHLLALCSYGSLTVFGILMCLGATSGSGGDAAGALAVSLAGVGLLVSAVVLVVRGVRRFAWEHVQQIPHKERVHEVIHYGLGAIGCSALCFAHLAFLPGVFFCLYSLYCVHRAGRAYEVENGY